MNDAGIKIAGVEKAPKTTKENWDEYRARLLENLARIQEATGKPKIFISSKLTDLDENGNEFNFLVKELENLRWEEVKTELGIEQKPIWARFKISNWSELGHGRMACRIGFWRNFPARERFTKATGFWDLCLTTSQSTKM